MQSVGRSQILLVLAVALAVAALGARALRADGLATTIGGVFNSFPYTCFAENVGLVRLTQVKSRWVVASTCASTSSRRRWDATATPRRTGRAGTSARGWPRP